MNNEFYAQARHGQSAAIPDPCPADMTLLAPQRQDADHGAQHRDHGKRLHELDQRDATTQHSDLRHEPGVARGLPLGQKITNQARQRKIPIGVRQKQERNRREQGRRDGEGEGHVTCAGKAITTLYPPIVTLTVGW